MWDPKIRVRNGPNRRIALVVRQDRGGELGFLIQPAQALEIGRDLIDLATTVQEKDHGTAPSPID